MRNSLLIFGALLLAGCSADDETEPAPVVQVKVARATLEDVRLGVDAPATVFPRAQADIASKITAPIRELAVRKGDRVSAGQVLAELENRDLAAQREETITAVTDAEAALAKISAGTLPTDIERARGQVVTTEAALRQAQQICDRRRELFEQGAIPNRELLASQTTLAQAKAQHEVARKSLELLEKHSKENDIQIARSQLDQARARVSYIEAQLEFTRIKSPYNGTVTEQFLYPGDMAQPASAIFRVMDLAVAVARAQVPEAEASGVRTGLECTFVPQDAPDTAITGHVSVVNQAVDPARRTVETWCEIGNTKRALRAGVFGAVRITTGMAPDSVVVPIEAVEFEEGTRQGMVLLASDEHRAVQRKVEAGITFGNKVQKAGERVVVEGGYGLADGIELRWTEGEQQR